MINSLKICACTAFSVICKKWRERSKMYFALIIIKTYSNTLRLSVKNILLFQNNLKTLEIVTYLKLVRSEVHPFNHFNNNAA